MMSDMTVIKLFIECANAIREHKLIHRESRSDKEFHFQNWVETRLNALSCNYEVGGRNSYPDFRMVHIAEGYEVKGLAYPGREVTYDSNSQVPTGYHNGRFIYYVFGRYPAQPDDDSYPVLDLVICHGDFLNADHDYVHKNRSLKGFGSYGDTMIRDRKMYVAPTPFGLASGLAHNQTLILPEDFPISSDLYNVGTLIRKEADTLIVGYNFDLRDNILTPATIPNPSSGKEHLFKAWRLKGTSNDEVKLHQISSLPIVVEDSNE